MRLGIVPALDPRGGGIHQYSMTMLRELGNLGSEIDVEVVVFATDPRHPSLREVIDRRWRVVPLDPPSLKGRIRRLVKRLVPEGATRDALRKLSVRPRPQEFEIDTIKARPDLGAWFRSNGVELMVYPAPVTMSFESGVPFIMAVHDLQHRIQPEFPEVSADGEWELREYLYRNAARYAYVLVADSEVGREDIVELYGEHGAAEDRVAVLPFLPAIETHPQSASRIEDVRARFRLPKRFLFYPAQFWPHKNHVRIAEALGLLKADGLDVQVVLSGSKAGALRSETYDSMMRTTELAGVRSNVHYLGYVDDADMPSLYAASDGLLMPTFFGPTNIPIIEAWAAGIAVVTSDLRGIREQVRDAAVLVDPRSERSIAEGMKQVWTDEPLRQRLIEAGRSRLRAYDAADYRRRLMEILERAKERLHDSRQ